MRKLLYFYQRFFWYVAQAKSEVLKPLGFWNETILILTFLTVRGYNIGITQVLMAYIVVIVAAAAIGKVIVAMGVVRYNTKIANHQNSELMEILERINRIEEYIKRK